MHDELDDDYEPEHDQYLDSGDELEEMFGDELIDPDEQRKQQPDSLQDDDYDPEDEYQAGLDEDW